VTILAHGGLAGLIVEILVTVAIVGVLLAAWLRQRRLRREGRDPDDLELPDA
jgi:hypothetical protein